MLFELSLWIKFRRLMNWEWRISYTLHKQTELFFFLKQRKRLKTESISKKTLDLPDCKINVLNVDRFWASIAFSYIKTRMNRNSPGHAFTPVSWPKRIRKSLQFSSRKSQFLFCLLCFWKGTGEHAEGVCKLKPCTYLLLKKEMLPIN